MTLELKEGVDLDGARTVRLAGRELAILPFTLRQTIAMSSFAPKLEGLAKGDKIDDEKLSAFVDVVRIGLSGAYPKVTNDDILDQPVTLAELVAASNVVVEQAGGRRADATAGESSATSDSATSTGISSSPSS